MSRSCDVCGKGKIIGGSITRRGLAKKQGGIGTHVVKNVKRTFRPNLQTVRAKTAKGNKRLTVCTACIRSNKVQKVG